MIFTSLILFTLFIIGAAVGSFTSVVIYRLHKGESGILRGRSKCPDCEVTLQPRDLMPLFSYMVLRGKCRFCDKEISYMYPLLEFLSGALFIFLFLKFPFLNEALHVSFPLLGMYLLYALYTFILLFTFFFDLRYLKVADEIVLPGIVIGLVATIATPFTLHIIDALLGAAIGIVFFGIQIILSRGQWVGQGDLRIGAFMGVILGWKLTIIALIISYLVGSIVALAVIARMKKFRGVKIPFAPILVTGTWLTIFFGKDILDWYLLGIRL